MSLLFNPGDLENATCTQGRVCRQLAVEASKAETFGKPLPAAMMRSLARVLPQVPQLYAHLEAWPGDLAADAVTFRLNAGLHALARAGAVSGLKELFVAGQASDVPAGPSLDAVVLEALSQHGEHMLGWLARPTQTNEVARVAGLVAALLELSRRDRFACEVLELGASAGLNLNFPHYCIELGNITACAALSPVKLRPAWRGRAVAARSLTVRRTRGVDLHPLDLADPAARARLRCYIWPGEHQRSARLDAAVALAQHCTPTVDKGHASTWLEAQLAEPQLEGVRRVVFHSMVLQYIAPQERADIESAFAAAGATATSQRPLARVSMEWSRDRSRVELAVTQWRGAQDDGVPVIAALCHPYGEWFDWAGLDHAG